MAITLLLCDSSSLLRAMLADRSLAEGWGDVGIIYKQGWWVVGGGCRGTHQSAPGHASCGSRVSVLKKASITALPPQCPAIDLPWHSQGGPRTSNLMRALNHTPGTLARCLMHQHVEEAGDQLPILHSKLVWACTDCPDNAAVE